MNTPTAKLVTLLLFVVLYNCSTVQVVDSYTSDNVETMKTKKTLVIVRSANEPIRTAFENEIAKQLRSKNLDVTESYKKFPKIDPTEELDEAKIKAIKKMLQDEGYNAVVVSVLKDIEEVSETRIEGGYEAGASFASAFYINNIGFYGYYVDPISYPSYDGVYVPQTMNTRTGKIYVVETSAYNLDLPVKEQLMAMVTSKIEETEHMKYLADDYAKAILKALKKKK
ncbi:hypothetical protein A9Q87_01380 [Flavobacteriales bacterium 34_180_T64]|nr:hypothetical protein A9Q87_01380 [Flavobacteriales bacterium 34_180_T64]